MGVVVFSICRIVQLNSSSQSIPNNALMSSRSVTSMERFSLIPSFSVSTVIFPVNLISFLLKPGYLFVSVSMLLSLIFLSSGISVTYDPVSTMNSLSVPSILSVTVM